MKAKLSDKDLLLVLGVVVAILVALTLASTYDSFSDKAQLQPTFHFKWELLTEGLKNVVRLNTNLIK